MAKRPTKKSSNGSFPTRSLAKHTLDHFRRFCLTLELPDGLGPMVLEGWEEAMLDDYFGERDPDDLTKWIREPIPENLWLIPTGNRKSMLIGALALHMGTYVRTKARIFLLGGLGGHGRNALDAAAGFVERDPKRLGRFWLPQEAGQGRLKCLIPGSKSLIIVKSAGRRKGGRGGSPVEGEAPDAIFVEEPHRHEDGGGAVRTLQSKAQKKSHSGWIVPTVHVTTAGDDDDSFLGKLRRRVTDVDAGCVVQRDLRPGEYYTRAVDADLDTVMHAWELPDEIQPPSQPTHKKGDLERYREQLQAFIAEVRKANPASWVTLTNLRRSFAKMVSEPWVFLRQHANQWVTQDSPALDRVGWFEGYDAGLKIPKGTKNVVVGLDLSDSVDKIGISPVWLDAHRHPVSAGSVILRPDAEHAGQALVEVIEVLLDMKKIWPGMIVAFDRHFGGGLLALQLERDHGITCADVGMKTPFEIASGLLAGVVSRRELRHDGRLTKHALAATHKRSRYVQNQWRLAQPSDGSPIDGVSALAMALLIAYNPPKLKRESLPASAYRVERL